MPEQRQQWRISMQQQIDVFVASLTSFWTQLAGFVPQLLAALLLLFVGWVLASLIRTGVVKLLDVLKFDDLSQKTGIDAFLKQGNINLSLSRIVANLIYWLFILVMIVMVSNSLGLHAVAELFNRVVLYIPNIIVAILVLVFGVLLARFINRLVFAYLNNMGVEGALTLSTISEYAVIIFVIFVALEQLEIGTRLLTAAFQIGFGAIGLALALAFGLGGREWAAGVIKRMTEKRNGT
jgi:small-conductance mechanosensitive channel